MKSASTSRYGAEPLEGRVLLADTVQLLQDINLTAQTYTTNAYSVVEVNGTVFFSGTDPLAGRELIATDGTQAGLRVVKDIYPGGGSSNADGPTNVNGTLYFFANDGVHGYELWKSDGTAAGTVMVKDINPGAEGSRYFGGVALGDTFFFLSGVDDALWKSDGTDAGTLPVKSLGYDVDNFGSGFLASNGTAVIFFSRDAATGMEPWKTDGTPGGTMIVKDIVPGPEYSNVYSLTPAGDLVYFNAVPVGGNADASQLFRTDGTADGTFPVAGSASQRTAVGRTLFFLVGPARTDDGDPSDLWTTDGTVAGTVRVKEFTIGPGQQLTHIVGTYSGGVLLNAYEPATGSEFWKSDGTEAGTVLVKDFVPGPGSSRAPLSAQEVNGTLWLSGSDQTNGFELWRSDGTAAGTTFVKDVLPGPAGSSPRDFHASASGNVVFVGFSIPPGRLGYQEWDVYSTDGTADGTRILRPIYGPTAGSDPQRITESGGWFYFVADDGAHGPELWRTGGTPGDVRRLTDTGATGMDILGDLNGTLIFSTFGSAAEQGTWRTDGTPAGTVKLTSTTGKGGPYAGVFGDALYFNSGTGDMWKTDGTVAGTQLLRSSSGTRVLAPRSMTDVNGTLMFFADDGVHGVELWKSDGTPAGTVMVKDINPVGGGWVGALTSIVTSGEVGYFQAFTPDTGYELWKTDGTEAGTVMVKDLTPGPGVGRGGPLHLTKLGNLIYFVQDAGDFQRLYQTDGTAAGTVPAVILDRTLTSFNSLFAYDDYLLINAHEYGGTDGRNLYRAEQGQTGLTLLRSNFQVDEYEENGLVYMAGRDEGESGLSSANEVWVTGGSAASTVRVADLYPGAFGAEAADLTAFEGLMVFAATSPQNGREPFVLTTDERSGETRNAAVVGRQVFYNNSTFDGNATAANAADDNAIAPDKQALLPGQNATFANVTSFTGGLNGIMIDVRGLAQDGRIEELEPDDFIIRTGPTGAPGDLASGPRNFTVTVRRGAGAGGSDRVTLTWPDGAIRNKWVQVTMKPTHDSGLVRPDVFYFGNLVGETGDPQNALAHAVSALDLAAVKRNLSSAAGVPITSPYDFNRDGRINALDLATVKANAFRRLALFAAPPPTAPTAGPAATAATNLLREG